MSIRVVLANIQGTQGLTREGITCLAQLAHQCDIVACLELLRVKERSPGQIDRRFTNPLAEIMCRASPSGQVSRARTFFFPHYCSTASPWCPKWKRLAARIGAPKDTVQSVSLGIGLIARVSLRPLFPSPVPFAAPAVPICGYLGTGSLKYSTLLYWGDRDSEQRIAVFLRVALGEKDVIICVTHLATILGERAAQQNAPAARLARHIRNFECREILASMRRLIGNPFPSRPCELLLLGDFNCLPSAPELAPLHGAGLDCVYDLLALPYPATKRQSGMCLDHVWISRGLRAASVETYRIGQSDDLALVAQITM